MKKVSTLIFHNEILLSKIGKQIWDWRRNWLQVLSERDLYSNLWKNYLILACSMLPPHAVFSGGSFRCISPDIALSTSSSESNCSEKSDARSGATHIPAVTAHGFYKMAVRLLRSEAADLPDSIVVGLGKTNPEALRWVFQSAGEIFFLDFSRCFAEHFVRFFRSNDEWVDWLIDWLSHDRSIDW